MKILGKYLYFLVGVICLGIGLLVYHNNTEDNNIILGDQSIGSGIGTAVSYIPVTFNGVNAINTFTDNVILPINKGVQVKQVNVKLVPGEKYYLAFDYKTKKGINKFKVDLYKNGKSILYIILEASPSLIHYEWPISSTDTNISDCFLRVYDDLFDSTDSGDIVVSNIKLIGSKYSANSKYKVHYEDGNVLGTLPKLTRAGYSFQGWYTAATGGSKVTEKTPVLNPMNLHPRWAVINVSSVTLDKTALTIIKSKTAKLNATVNPKETLDKTVTWTSSNTKVATVDGNGNIKALTEGTTNITVTSKKNTKAKAICKVTVVKGTNPITLAAKSDLTYSYSVKEQTKAFPAATKAQGPVTYKIISQKNSSGADIKLFSIPTSSKPNLKVVGKAATGKYTIVVRATAVGDANYKAGSKDITLTVYIKTTNPMKVTTPLNLSFNYSLNKQTKAFTAPTKAQGAVTYTIKSQKNSNGANITAFSIADNKHANITVANKVVAGTYTVVVVAKAAGNNYYYSSSQEITLKITINGVNNPMVVKTPQSFISGKSATVQKITFEAPTKAQGTVTYSVPSSKNNATIRKYFTIPTATKTKNIINVAANTPTGNYAVTVLASASGDINYKKKDSYIVVNVNVVEKKTNTIKVSSNGLKTVNYSTSNQDITFTKATNAQGTVTYSIPGDKNNPMVRKNFTIPTVGTASVRIAKKTPPGSYDVVIRATATGNNLYNSGYKDMSIKVVVNQLNSIMNVNANQTVNITPSKSNQDISFSGVTGAAGKVTYTIPVDKNSQSIRNNFTIPTDINSAAKVRVKANTPTGDYTIKILASDTGDIVYKKGTKEITLKVKIVQQVLKGSAEIVIDDGYHDELGQAFCLNQLKNVKGLSLSNVDSSIEWTSSLYDIVSPVKSYSCGTQFIVFSLSKAKNKTVTLTGKKDGLTVMEIQAKVVLAKYTLTFNGTNTKYTREIGSKIGTLPTPPAQAGKKFIGWSSDLFNIISGNTIVTKNVTYYPLWVDNVTSDSKYDNYKQIARYESSTLDYRVIQDRNDKQGNYITLIWVKDALKQMNNALACRDASCSKKGDDIINQEINTYKYQNKGLVAVNASFYSPTDKPEGKPNGIIFSHDELVKSNGSGVVGLNSNYELKEFPGDLNTLQRSGVTNTFSASGRTVNDNCRDHKKCSATRTQICQIDKYNYAILSYGGTGLVKDAADYLSNRVNCKKDSLGVIIFNLDGGGSRMFYYKKNTANSLVKVNGGGRLIPDMLYFVEQ